MYSLIPNLIYDSIIDLTPDVLNAHDIRVLLMDFDNTIVPYTSNEPEESFFSWLDAVKAAGIHLCVVSNTKKGRAIEFCRRQGIDCITHAKKPFQKGIGRAKEKYAGFGRIALVGDQIFTDTWAGKRLGMKSYLLPPIRDKRDPFTRFKRLCEKPVLRRYYKEMKEKEEEKARNDG